MPRHLLPDKRDKNQLVLAARKIGLLYTFVVNSEGGLLGCANPDLQTRQAFDSDTDYLVGENWRQLGIPPITTRLARLILRESQETAYAMEGNEISIIEAYQMVAEEQKKPTAPPPNN